MHIFRFLRDFMQDLVSFSEKEIIVLHWAFLFFIISIGAALFGNEELAGIAGHIGLLVFGLFAGLLVFSLIMSFFKRSKA